MARRKIKRPTLTPEESLKRTKRAYRLWLRNYGLRQLEQMFGIAKSTLSDRFKLLYGVDYSQKRNSKGLVRVLQEYRQNPKLSRQQRIEVTRFLANNLEAIAEIEAKYPDALYNDRELSKLTHQQCCKGQDDYSVYIDRHHIVSRPLSTSALREQ